MQRFIACKRRNVAAAYERFLGPDAGALEEPWPARTWYGLIRIFRIPSSRVREARLVTRAEDLPADPPA